MKLEREMNQKWTVCRNAFSRCKKQQDAALAFVSKCKTSTTAVEKQYKELVIISNSIDRVFDKIESVLKASQEAANQLNRATLIIVTCPVFTGRVDTFTTLVQVLQGTRQGRSLANLLDLVDQIIYVTIYPACNTNEMASLTSAKELVVKVQAAVASQIHQIKSILSHLQDTTIVPSFVGTEQVKLNNLQR